MKPTRRRGKEDGLQDLLDHRPQATGSRSTVQRNPGDLLDRRIREHQVCSVEPNQLPELLDQRPFWTLKNSGEILNAKSIQRRYHWQPTNYLWDQPELFEVFRLHLPQQPIGSHLAVFGHLTEPEPTSPEPLGDDVLQPHERPAADEQGTPS